jgi:hypothetical protein
MLAGVCSLRVTRVEVAFLAILAVISDSRLCPVMMGYDRVLRHFLRQDCFCISRGTYRNQTDKSAVWCCIYFGCPLDVFMP